MLADIRGVSINYEISGNESGPWLTFSNSLATNLHMWDEQEAALADDFHILRYDKRGHGKSAPVEGPYTFDDLVGDVVGLWDHLGISEEPFRGSLDRRDDRAGAPAQPCGPGHGHGHGEHLCAQRRSVYRGLRPARGRGRGRRHGGGRRVDHRALVLRGLSGKRRCAHRRCAAHDPHDLGRGIHGLRARHPDRSRISTGWARSTIPSC